jgi:putative two-component system response regulator
MDVVIVDDERTSIALLQHFVRKFDCTPVRFTHPTDGLQWCATHSPGLVIVDYQMPEMDGLEFTRRFRALPDKAAVPILMVTASTDRLLRQHALRIGVNSFMRKPIDRALFSAFMESVLPQPATFRDSPQREVVWERRANNERRAPRSP